VTPRFFKTPSAFRKWLEAHHATAKELWVGFYKKGTGWQSITWPESVDGRCALGGLTGYGKSSMKTLIEESAAGGRI